MANIFETAKQIGHLIRYVEEELIGNKQRQYQVGTSGWMRDNQRRKDHNAGNLLQRIL